MSTQVGFAFFAFLRRVRPFVRCLPRKRGGGGGARNDFIFSLVKAPVQ